MDTKWTSTAGSELGLGGAVEVDRALVLDVAREVARVTARPWWRIGPQPRDVLLTTFLLGVAVGRGMPEAEAAHRITELARRWSGVDCDWRD